MNTRTMVNTLLIINIIVFLFEQVLHLNNTFGLYFITSPKFQIYQPVTYMFMHAGFMHLFFNMFALWMFGRALEMVWGPKRFLIYYLVCGIGAAAIQELGQAVGLISSGSMTVGASGAVYGILLAFGLTFPNDRIFIFPIPIPIKAKYFVLFYVVIELMQGFGASDGVAHFAHLGGMLFGALLFLYWKHQIRIRKNRKVRVIYERPSSVNEYHQNAHEYTTTQNTSYEQREKIDSILDKIRANGYNSLTNEEKNILFDASKK